jgi:hypothetical protein
VKGIPANQRSIRTIAKVGGLVGKTMAIDESTHYKAEFVRVKIACRDIYEVPASAEGNLGLHIFDFFFELEEPENMKREAQKSSVEVTDNDKQPNLKRMKTGEAHQSHNMSTSATKIGGDGGNNKQNTMSSTQQYKQVDLFCTWED